MTISFVNPRFVGFDNFRVILNDPFFFKALFNSFVLSFSNIFVGLTLGMILAIFLSFKFKGRGVLNSMFFVPAMLPIAFIAVVFG